MRHPPGERAGEIFRVDLRPEASDVIEIDHDFSARLGLRHKRSDRLLEIGRMLEDTETQHLVEAVVRERHVVDARLEQVETLWRDLAVGRHVGIDGSRIVDRPQPRFGMIKQDARKAASA